MAEIRFSNPGYMYIHNVGNNELKSVNKLKFNNESTN